jgi:hypothetical protein
VSNKNATIRLDKVGGLETFCTLIYSTSLDDHATFQQNLAQVPWHRIALFGDIVDTTRFLSEESL